MIEDCEDDEEYGLEDKAYDEQYDLIKKDCGKKAADNANYGWFVDGREDRYTYIETKVYGHGVLKSTCDHELQTITHDWM